MITTLLASGKKLRPALRLHERFCHNTVERVAYAFTNLKSLLLFRVSEV